MCFNLFSSNYSAAFKKHPDVFKGNWSYNFWATRQQVRVKVESSGAVTKQVVVQGILFNLISSFFTFIGFRSWKNFGKQIKPDSSEWCAVKINGFADDKKQLILQRQRKTQEERLLSLKQKAEEKQGHYRAIHTSFAEETPEYEGAMQLDAAFTALLHSIPEFQEDLQKQHEALRSLEQHLAELEKQASMQETAWSKGEKLLAEIASAKNRLARHMEFLREKMASFPLDSIKTKEVTAWIEEHQRTLLEEPFRLSTGYVDGLKEFVWKAILQDRQRLRQIEEAQVDLTKSQIHFGPDLSEEQKKEVLKQKIEEQAALLRKTSEAVQRYAQNKGFDAVLEEALSMHSIIEKLSQPEGKLSVYFETLTGQTQLQERLEQMHEMMDLATCLAVQGPNLMIWFSNEETEQRQKIQKLTSIELKGLQTTEDLLALRKRTVQLIEHVFVHIQNEMHKMHVNFRDLDNNQVARYLIQNKTTQDTQLLEEGKNCKDLQSFFGWQAKISSSFLKGAYLFWVLDLSNKMSLESLVLEISANIAQQVCDKFPTLESFSALKEKYHNLPHLSLNEISNLLSETNHLILSYPEIDKNEWGTTYAKTFAALDILKTLYDCDRVLLNDYLSKKHTLLQDAKESGSSDMVLEKFQQSIERLSQLTSVDRNALTIYQLVSLIRKGLSIEAEHETYEMRLKKIDRSEKNYRQAHREADLKLQAYRKGIKNSDGTSIPQYAHMWNLEQLLEQQVGELRELGKACQSLEEMRLYRHRLKHQQIHLENTIDLMDELDYFEQFDILPQHPYRDSLKKSFLTHLHSKLDRQRTHLEMRQRLFVDMTKSTDWNANSYQKMQEELQTLKDSFSVSHGYFGQKKVLEVSSLDSTELLKAYAVAVDQTISQQNIQYEKETAFSAFDKAIQRYAKASQKRERLEKKLMEKNQFVHLRALEQVPFQPLTAYSLNSIAEVRQMIRHLNQAASKQIARVKEIANKPDLTEIEQLKLINQSSSDYRLLHESVRREAGTRLQAFKLILSDFNNRIFAKKAELLQMDNSKDQALLINNLDSLQNYINGITEKNAQMMQNFSFRNHFWEAKALIPIDVKMSPDQLAAYHETVNSFVQAELENIKNLASDLGFSFDG